MEESLGAASSSPARLPSRAHWFLDAGQVVRTPTSTSTQVPTVSSASAPVTGQATGARACPVPQSGTCLGKLTAGQYTSLTFQPKLTFRVTNGWANYLDMSGLYLLQPPGAQPPGNSIVGSFVGLETSVAPEALIADHAQVSMPTSRRRSPFPCLAKIEPRRWSRSVSVSDSASWIRSPARQSATIRAVRRWPWRSSPAWRMTATISSMVGGSAG